MWCAAAMEATARETKMDMTAADYIAAATRNAGAVALGIVINADGKYSAMKQYAAECDRMVLTPGRTAADVADWAAAAKLLRKAMAMMLPMCSVDCRRMEAA